MTAVLTVYVLGAVAAWPLMVWAVIYAQRALWKREGLRPRTRDWIAPLAVAGELAAWWPVSVPYFIWRVARRALTRLGGEPDA